MSLVSLMHLQLEEHRVEALFPTLLFSAKITDKKYLEDLKKRILQMTKDPSKGTKEGNVAWISHDNMQEMEEFQDLHDLLLRESVQIFKYYSIVCDSVYLTSMWANVGYKPEYCHQNHIHPNSMFSGVLHVSIPSGASGTQFGDPRPAARIFDPNVRTMAAHNSGMVDPPAEDGMLYMFPSYLPHGVHSTYKSFGKNNPRITVSFNAMMTGKMTTRTAPLTLK